MPSLNLTDEQMELLRILVSNYEAGARVFWFVRGGTTGISYPKGVPASVLCDEMDLDQLKRSGFINLTRVSKTTSKGKPTQLGIDTVHEELLRPKSQSKGPAISIPNFNEYPPDFDDAELDEIKAAELRAAQVIGLREGSVRSKAEREILLLRDWVLPIFAAFSKLALNRAKEGRWAIHKADSESRGFVKVLAASAGMNSPDAWMAGGGRIIPEAIQNEIERSAEWKHHQEMLLKLVEARDHANLRETTHIEALSGCDSKKPSEAPRRAAEASSRQPEPQAPDPVRLMPIPSAGTAGGAMADLPELSEYTKRKLAVQWDTIRETQKLTDEDLSRYDRERQRLLSGIAAKPPVGTSGVLKHAAERAEPKLVARRIGFDPSVKAAEARFRQTDAEYWQHWCSSGATYERYAGWLDRLKRDTVAELALIWNGRSAATDRWFRDTCGPAIEEALAALVKQRVAQARDVESNRPERFPPSTLAPDEIRAAGNVSPEARKATEAAVIEMNAGTDRRKAVDAYIDEVFSRTGKRITRTAIWKLARYQSRTEFERWERNDTKNPNKTAHERFTRILIEKPHLK